VPVRTEGLFGAPDAHVTNRAADISPRISSAKCVLLWGTAAEAVAQSNPVRLSDEIPGVLDKQEDVKVVVDVTASA
jgi:hypothetical protein